MQIISKLGILVGVAAFVAGVAAAWIFERPPDIELSHAFPAVYTRYGLDTSSHLGASVRRDARTLFRQFQKSLAADHRNEVASMIQENLTIQKNSTVVIDGHYTKSNLSIRTVESSKDLLRDYDKIFTPAVKKYIAAVNPEDIDFVPENESSLRVGTKNISIYLSVIGSMSDSESGIRIAAISTASTFPLVGRALVKIPHTAIYTPHSTGFAEPARLTVI